MPSRCARCLAVIPLMDRLCSTCKVVPRISPQDMSNHDCSLANHESLRSIDKGKRKKKDDDDGEVTYINDRNKVFNQKVRPSPPLLPLPLALLQLPSSLHLHFLNGTDYSHSFRRSRGTSTNIRKSTSFSVFLRVQTPLLPRRSRSRSKCH